MSSQKGEGSLPLAATAGCLRVRDWECGAGFALEHNSAGAGIVVEADPAEGVRARADTQRDRQARDASRGEQRKGVV